MAILDIEKPSEWYIGKKIGFLPILLLIFGSFVPFAARSEVSFIGYWYLGLYSYFPIISAILMILLLYLKFPLYIQRDLNYVKINNFILLLIGVWFSWQQLQYGFPSFRGVGVGYYLLVFGFLFYTIVASLQLKYEKNMPQKVIPIDLHREKSTVYQKPTYPSPQKIYETQTSPKKEKPISQSQIQERRHGQVPIPQSPPPIHIAEPKKIEKEQIEPQSEEERALMRWAGHIDKRNEAYEECMNCQKYVFMKAKETDSFIEFNCPDCNAKFILNK